MRRQKGFTLIELLIVVAIIGIIAAIAIPNLLNAINRGRQKRTMADIRTIGTGIEAYAVDVNVYPLNLSGKVESTLVGIISPTYVKVLPEKDGWGKPLCFVSNASGTEYTIYSLAADNTAGSCSGYTYNCGTAKFCKTTDFKDDIIFANGQFTQWPEGIQQ
jgi:general secretion pathway protein G